jgi:hypothetical protein
MFPLDSEEITNLKEEKKPNKNITNSLFGALKDSSIDQNDYKKHLEDKYLS